MQCFNTVVFVLVPLATTTNDTNFMQAAPGVHSAFGEPALPTVQDTGEDAKGGEKTTPPPLPRRRFEAPSEGAVLMPSVTVRGKGGFAMGGGVGGSPPPLPSRVG